MITTIPRSLNVLVAFLFPRIEQTIEPIEETKTINEVDSLFLKNLGKKDRNKFSFSSNGAVGFRE
jgi:hypothetical protein